MTFQGTQYTKMPEESREQKKCLVCGTMFTPRCGPHKYCSNICKDKWKYMCGKVTNETQYKNISGNWSRYFDRLLGKGRREFLTRQLLLEQLEKQQGLCALSGVRLTCQLKVGVKFKTNASIDRILPGKSYSPDNIQLVCSALNSFRKDTELNEFIWFCKQVTKYQERKEG